MCYVFLCKKIIVKNFEKKKKKYWQKVKGMNNEARISEKCMKLSRTPALVFYLGATNRNGGSILQLFLSVNGCDTESFL